MCVYIYIYSKTIENVEEDVIDIIMTIASVIIEGNAGFSNTATI